jgi:hypothetical protein
VEGANGEALPQRSKIRIMRIAGSQFPHLAAMRNFSFLMMRLTPRKNGSQLAYVSQLR